MAIALFRVGIVDSDKDFTERLELEDALSSMHRLIRRRGNGPYAARIRRRGHTWSPRRLDGAAIEQKVREWLPTLDVGGVVAVRRSDGGVVIIRVAKPKPEPRVAFDRVPVPCGGYQDGWGAPRSGHDHQGIDIFALAGSPITAPFDGTLRFSFRGTSAGWAADIVAADGRGIVRNFHCQKTRIRPDGPVKSGDQCANVGNTGNALHTPAHSHFEFHAKLRSFDAVVSGNVAKEPCSSDGTACDPFAELNAAYGKIGGGTRGRGRPC
ncbi:MAG TPA: M23 family metallopeptidase [Actinomycetota bacterium]